ALLSFPSLPPFVGFSLKVFCLKLNSEICLICPLFVERVLELNYRDFGLQVFINVVDNWISFPTTPGL
ncbi:hypothetical protein LINGRAPRIM_LOCUS2982, partial [Linum grandiflorum]